VKQCANSHRSDEGGFLLVEALISVAMIGVCAGALIAAIVAVTHATAHRLPTSSLMLTAQDILTDLRAATAYDSGQLAALAGRTAAFDVAETGPDGLPHSVHIVAGVTRSAATGAYVGSVTARGFNGAVVTIQATLVQEAPPPGSVVPAGTPAAEDSAGGAVQTQPAGCDRIVACSGESGGILL
jgi:hypothetical protein